MLSEKVISVITNPKVTMYLATYSDEANVVPVGLKTVVDGKIVIGDVFMKYSVANVKETGKAAVAVFDPETKASYEIKGAAEYVTEGPAAEAAAAMAQAAFKGAMSTKGAVVITPDKVVNTAPGPDNNKVF